MGLVLVILLIALILGGIGLAAHALWWMLILAGALVIASIVLGTSRRHV
jgi:hypothetical protein